MIGAAHSAPLFFTQLRFWEGMTTVAVAWVGSYFKWFRPLLRERREHDAQRARERDAVYGFVLGLPADGLRPEVIAAPIQMKHLTDTVDGLAADVRAARDSNEEVVRGQASVVETVEGFRTDIGKLDEKVSAIQSGTETLVHESKTNEGGSMRDVVDAQGVSIGEIQDEQARVREEKRETDEG